MLPLVAKREADYAQLVAAREVSVHDYLEHQQARLDLAGQLAAARAQRAALVAQTRKTALDALAQALQTDETSDEDARRAQAHCAALSLTAPVDGTIHQLTLHTVGGVVPAAQPLLQIVPAAAAVEVEATLANRDVGFVRPGQDAQVKVEAFDYTKYGTVPARVTLVSRDAVLDGKRGLIYTVRVVLDRATLTVDGEPRRLSPGMAVTVDLKTGTRRVIDYVLSPLIDHVSGSLHER
jgi:hemolysin D